MPGPKHTNKVVGGFFTLQILKCILIKDKTN